MIEWNKLTDVTPPDGVEVLVWFTDLRDSFPVVARWRTDRFVVDYQRPIDTGKVLHWAHINPPGEHVAKMVAAEAAREIERLRAKLAEVEAEYAAAGVILQAYDAELTKRGIVVELRIGDQ